MNQFSLDYETRSRADLKTVGAFRYAEDPSTEIFCAAVARGNEEPHLWVNPKFECEGVVSDPEASAIIREQSLPDSVVWCHNAYFEAAITMYKGEQHGLVITPDQWRCTAALARRANIPASLEKGAEVLGLSAQKDSKGKALITKFSVPSKKTGQFFEPQQDPVAFRAFGDYCLQDVRVEQQFHQQLKVFDLKDILLETFQFDMRMNMRGVTVNVEALRHVWDLITVKKQELVNQFRDMVGFNPSQGVVFLAWLKERGYTGDDLTADTVAAQIKLFGENTEIGRLLKLKQSLSFAAVDKIPKMLKCVCSDGRVRGTVTFYGAQTTGRWAGKDMQIHNMKRSTKRSLMAYADLCAGANSGLIEIMYGPFVQVVAESIRHFIQDPEGPIYDVDFSSIEARILAWLADEEWKLEVFRTHGKIYEATASRMTGVSLAEMQRHVEETGEHHPDRSKGKVAELALGYQGAVGALIKMGALDMGLTEEELPDIVSKWREVNPKIKAYWHACERAMVNAIQNPGTKVVVGKVSYFLAQLGGVVCLCNRLPSGRCLVYREPQVNWVRDVLTEEDKKAGKKARMRQKVSYWGHIEGITWGRVDIYGGQSTENQCQGIAYDIMAHGAVKAEKKGFEIFTLIHDQALAYKGDPAKLPILCDALKSPPPWAKGLPIDVEGKIVPYYKK